jgi:HAD superfamily hydrolase (TIGR01509 family)
MIHALIFDFDGLILDTEQPVYQSWSELYESYGFPLPFSTWAAIIGTSYGTFDPRRELERLLGKRLDWESTDPKRRAREFELIEKQPVLPGVEAYLKDAKRLGLKTGLASSSSCKWVTGHLTRRGLVGYFDVIRARDDVQRTKPDPELYCTVLAELGVRGEEAIALEDSPNGIRAAKRAGMWCVAVPNPLTRQLGLEEADLRLDSLAEVGLEELIQRLDGATARN